MHLCTDQGAPSGLVSFTRLVFQDGSCTVLMNIHSAQRRTFRAQDKRGQSENVPANSNSQKIGFCVCLRVLAITCSHVALQQWEERATVTNSFAATKVAGNLSNGTIKLQLHFFSFFFFYSKCMDLRGYFPPHLQKSQTGCLQFAHFLHLQSALV